MLLAGLILGIAARLFDIYIAVCAVLCLVRVFEKHGFSAKAYHEDTATLKQRLTGGVPIIVFVSIPNDTHYAVVVGYDAQYFYLVDSLEENKNADDTPYNRKLTTDEFEKIRKTDTILSDNIYIVPSILDGKTMR